MTSYQGKVIEASIVYRLPAEEPVLDVKVEETDIQCFVLIQTPRSQILLVIGLLEPAKSKRQVIFEVDDWLITTLEVRSHRDIEFFVTDDYEGWPTVTFWAAAQGPYCNYQQVTRKLEISWHMSFDHLCQLLSHNLNGVKVREPVIGSNLLKRVKQAEKA